MEIRNGLARRSRSRDTRSEFARLASGTKIFQVKLHLPDGGSIIYPDSTRRSSMVKRETGMGAVAGGSINHAGSSVVEHRTQDYLALGGRDTPEQEHQNSVGKQ